TLHATPGPAGPEPEVVELRPPKAITSRLQGHEGVLWLLAAGAFLFIGILKGINLVVVLAYVLAGLWVINWLLARRAVRGLSARRPPRPPLVAGVTAEWPLEIRDDGPAGGNWVLEERVGSSVASWLVVRAGAGAIFRPRVRATFPRRGRYTLDGLTARSSFPFGLAPKSVRLLPPDEIIVLPRPARVDGERLRAWLYQALIGAEEERRKRRRVVEREAEIHGLRDYRHGDSPRRIHWKATARRNRLTVREYEDAAPPRLLLVVEPWLPATTTVTDRDRLEAVISLAAGVCREWRLEPGARLALVIMGPKPVAFDSPAGPGGTERLLVALALQDGGTPPEDLTGILRSLNRAALTAPTLVLSSRADSPVPAAMGRALSRVVAFAHVGRSEGWYKLE
ncbi:MAG TPA: DUF58 domain-containing protein, partial [Gemmataceae bacterium]|nr:DUF58 domain-containing protein [Gemmataceae bacterium]